MDEQLKANEVNIVEGPTVIQGGEATLDGYYHPSLTSTEKVMRPSATLNGILGG